eukprot:c1464_g1_i1.p1 GENE.c1464_g1_i1~~c1464_g1_i1.p1  ORF type:complete len:316 (-),score=59.81 c1464_g1_i1:32-979(-)
MSAMDVDSENTNKPVNATTSSAVQLLLHPIVLMNISDHITRMSYLSQDHGSSSHQKVIGALLGTHKGRALEISSSFEMVLRSDTALHTDLLTRKAAAMKKVFPDLDVVGWYTIGASIQPSDHAVHRTMCELFDTALFMLVDSVITKSRSLPITIFEGDLRIVDNTPTIVFTQSPFHIETQEAERIAVDHISHVQAGSIADSSGTSQFVTQLRNLHSSISMLSSRMQVISQFMEATANKKIELDHNLVRQVANLRHSLPAVNSQSFRQEFNGEFNDNLMIGYLAAITAGCSTSHEVIDKIRVFGDSSSRKVPRSGF